MNNNDFLPATYDVPSNGDNYMKFEQGENRFRILTSPILGWENWIEIDGARKPVRRPMDKPFSTNDVENPDDIRHFWAMVVWNYKSEKIQILEITQKGIQKTLRALARDKDWGTPVQTYDIVVTRTGEQMETRYEVLPKPATKLDAGIKKLFEDMSINLDALYKGDDPFAEANDVSSNGIAEDAVQAGL